SRSTVWRWVQRLRELGVRVKGQHANGYFLEEVPDILTPDLLRKRMKGSLFGKHLYHFFKTDSTNRMAMELGYAGEPEGAVVLAEEQTAGRGRAGRSWHSERGTGIYATLLLRPQLSPVLAPLLTMLAGLSSRAAIQAQTGLTAELKWPNDLLLNRGARGQPRQHGEQGRQHRRKLGPEQQRGVDPRAALGMPTAPRAASPGGLFFRQHHGAFRFAGVAQFHGHTIGRIRLEEVIKVLAEQASLHPFAQQIGRQDIGNFFQEVAVGML